MATRIEGASQNERRLDSPCTSLQLRPLASWAFLRSFTSIDSLISTYLLHV